MKAISLHPPWGSLIILGYKGVECRTHDRFGCLVGGRVAIHQARAWHPEYAHMIRRYLDRDAEPRLWRAVGDRDAWPRGQVLGDVRASDLRGLTAADSRAALCDAAGLWGLVVEDIRRIVRPGGAGIPAKGHQGIWEWDEPFGLRYCPVALRPGAIAAAAPSPERWWNR